MFPFSLFTHPGRQVRTGTGLRARLAVEELGIRATPGSLDGTTPVPVPSPAPTLTSTAGPTIVNFSGVQTSPGWYMFTGTVKDSAPGGLTVTFGGVPSLQGKTVVTASDGSFSLLVQVKTDGSDAGTVTAVTTDSFGFRSNVATCYISPTK
ncbi:MAG: hypothetical protein JWO38_7833 [Gemmataceae bacterium]|nr:hypothetical protein [Gemmataceae bacterium]